MYVLGGGELDEAKKLGNKLYRVSLIAGIISGLIILAISPLLVSMSAALTQEGEEKLQVLLVVCSYYRIVKSINRTVISGINVKPETGAIGRADGRTTAVKSIPAFKFSKQKINHPAVAFCAV